MVKANTKNVTKKLSKKQIKILKPIWEDAKKLANRYWDDISALEKQAEVATGVDIELFHCEGCLVGIGNYSRTIKLIQPEELE